MEHRCESYEEGYKQVSDFWRVVGLYENPQEMVARSNRIDPVVARILHSTDTRLGARAVHLHFVLNEVQTIQRRWRMEFEHSISSIFS